MATKTTKKAASAPVKKAVAAPAKKAVAAPAPAKKAAPAPVKKAVAAPAKKAVAAPAPAKKAAPAPVKKVAPVASKKAAPAAATKKSSASKEVLFRVCSPESSSVAIAGEFNSWNPEKGVMKKVDAANWEIKLKLVPGSYQYKIVHNGTSWELDSSADSIPAEHGPNSIVHVG